MKNYRILIAVSLVTIFLSVCLFADPDMSANLNGDRYEVGDVVSVSVRVDNNPGLHSVFFDLTYNGAVLSFDSLTKGLLIDREPLPGKLYYAASDSVTSGTLGYHVIVSYSLDGANTSTPETGELALLRFRVIAAGTPGATYRFAFSGKGAYDAAGSAIAGAQWADSGEFSIGSIVQSGFINIGQPYENELFYTNTVSVGGNYTAGVNNTVVLSNTEAGYTSPVYPGTSGYFENKPVPLAYGFNRIVAILRGIGNNEISKDTVTVYRARDEQYVKILDPRDRSLLNRDLVQVRVESSYSNLTLNGMPVPSAGDRSGDKYLFSASVWLKSGFNTITASSKAPDNAIYKHSITVYYYKDDSVFRITDPFEGHIFKSGDNLSFVIKGEIGSRNKTGAGDNAVQNNVTLKVIYYPLNPIYGSRELVSGMGTKIAETSSGSPDAQAPYTFTANMPVDISGLESGKIEIVAYKNKTASSCDDEIHRTVFIDSSRLWINIVQPNVTGTDILDTGDKIESFSGPEHLPVFTGTETGNDGAIGLKPTERIVVGEQDLSGKKVKKVIESFDHSLYCLVNENRSLQIYKKAASDPVWNLVVSESSMYGYDICDSSSGLLVGVSNLFSSENSGLYILKGKSLVNISLGEPLPHVQFIKNIEGTVYLYGNDFSNLYAFNLFTLESDNGRLVTKSRSTLPFDTNISIGRFELSGDAKTAMILDTTGKAYFYQNPAGSGFSLVDFDDELFDPSLRFSDVVYGEYADGNYNAFLLLRQGGAAGQQIVVMEQKTTGKLIPAQIDLGTALALASGDDISGVCTKDGLFHFFIATGTPRSFIEKTGHILFNSFFELGAEYSFVPTSGVQVPIGLLSCFAASNGNVFAFNPAEIGTTGLFLFMKSYPETGSAEFSYSNDDSIGFTAFSFEADPIWLEQGGIGFGFDVVPLSGGNGISQPVVSLHDFSSLTTPDFAVTHDYDPSLKKEIVHVSFSSLRQNSRIDFHLRFSRVGTSAPAISGLSIFKQIPVRLPKGSAPVIELPIRGFIYDPTVKEVLINEAIPVKLESNGAFSTNYPISIDKESIDITLSCTNSAGDTATARFTVKLFDSVNSVFDIGFKSKSGSGDEQSLSFSNGNELVTSQETLEVNGKYFGLIGVTVGYELYKYVNKDGSIVPELASQGLFDKVRDLTPGYGLGTGNESGSFSGELKLLPGKQQLKIYAENPGGLRTIFVVNDITPDVVYNIPDSDQKIVITNLFLKDQAEPYENVSSIKMKKELDLDVYESPKAPFIYSRNYIVYGEIKTLYQVSEIKVKAMEPGIVFDNNASETTVIVDKFNRFQASFTVTIPEKTEGAIYHLGFIPAPPFLDWIKTGLKIKASKSFTDTCVIPDFSPMDPASTPWTSGEIQALAKPLRIKIKDNRFVPQGASVNLVTNFETTTDGTLQELNPGEGIYKVVRGTDEVSLTGVKLGRNRVQWTLFTRDGKIISTSFSGKQDMTDFVFDLASSIVHAATEISFPITLGTYYNDGTIPLPSLSITKDSETEMKILLNKTVVWEDTEKKTTNSVDLKTASILQGRNNVDVVFTEKGKTTKTESFFFLYDTADPKVAIESYVYDVYDDVTGKVKEVSAIITEANIADIELFIGPVGNRTPVPSIPRIFQLTDSSVRAVWTGLETLNDPLKPTLTNPLTVTVTDHSGKTGSASFTGLANVTPPPVVSKIQVTGIPLTYVNAAVTLENLTIGAGSTFTEEKQKDVSIRDNVVVSGNGTTGGSLTLRGTRDLTINPVHDDKPFVVNLGGTFSAVIDDTIPQASPAYVSHPQASNAITFMFWFNTFQKSYYVPDESLRRILTLYQNGSNTLYLGYKDLNGYTTGNEYLYVYQDNGSGAQMLINGENGLPINSGQSQWNLIVVSVDTIDDTIRVSVNDLPAKSAVISEEMASFIVGQHADNYYFGSLSNEESGTFNLSDVYYIDKRVEADDLKSIGLNTGLYETISNSMERSYSFDNATTDVGTDKYFKLRTTGNDWFVPAENSDYLEQPTSENPRGSVKGSSFHKNAVTVKDNLLVFTDSTNPVAYNVSITQTEDNSFRLVPLNDNYSGKYYFGNTLSSHELKADRYYSVTGTILPLEENGKRIDPDAKLVLRINGIEKSKNLSCGDFHHVFDFGSSVSPTSVMMYIETKKPIKVKKNIVLSDGDYVLPSTASGEIAQSWVSTRTVFGRDGTVHFRYKPFNTNENGFVSYPSVIFDSEYLTIGSSLKSGNAYYCLDVKGPNGSNPGIHIPTDEPVRIGWHHLQATYSLSDSETNDMVYFYVDGKLAGKYEGGDALPRFGSIIGTIPQTDNVFLGTDIAHTRFAEGYIDNVVISHLFSQSLYTDKNPLSFSYSDTPVPTLTVSNALGVTGAENARFVIESLNRDYAAVYDRPGSFVFGTTGHGINPEALEPGMYRLKTKMTINGHAYDNHTSFVKDDKPGFTIKSHTPLVIKALESTINFSLGYDNSYLLKSTIFRYAAVAVRISGALNDEPFTRTAYITQDFWDGDPNTKKWLCIFDSGLNWKDIDINGDSISFGFAEVKSDSNITWDIRPFIFENSLDPVVHAFERLEPYKNGVIPIASMDVKPITKKYSDAATKVTYELEYKLNVKVAGESNSTQSAIFDALSIGYNVSSRNPSAPYAKSGVISLNGQNAIDIYYDDLLQTYGTYDCVLSLRYAGETYYHWDGTLVWQDEKPATTVPVAEKKLDIVEFSLLSLDRENNVARFYLEYGQSGFNAAPDYKIEILSGSAEIQPIVVVGKLPLDKSFLLVPVAGIPKDKSYVRLTLSSDEIENPRIQDISIFNNADAPAIALTNTVPSLIAYNNVKFSWRGTLGGVFKPDIRYSYNFDNQNKNWTAAPTDARELELYGLKEGYHSFSVKAIYNGEESPIESVTFFVDIYKPAFDKSKISVTKIYDDTNVFSSVIINGTEGAITDASLVGLTVNGSDVTIGANGSFTTGKLDITKDGDNLFTLAAFDKVGNTTEYPVTIENPLTSILFPDTTKHVRFAPMTVIGKIDPAVSQRCSIYIFDAMCKKADSGSYTSWKKATINEDRTFFVENVFVNPGSQARENHTPIEMALVFENGKTFTRTIDVIAKEILMPIEMSLSTHAVEGGATETNVDFTCTANVDNIASWSIDFDGDGKYDTVKIVDNQLLGKTYSVSHRYSAIGELNPRVRVITLDGNFFSVSDRIIIHEKIKEASNTGISDPIAMSVVALSDGSSRIYALAGKGNNYRIEVYEVGKNDTYISDRLFNISLAGLGIDGPVRIKAVDTSHLYIAGNRSGRGHINLLAENELGNYLLVPSAHIMTSDAIKDIDGDAASLYVSFMNANAIEIVPLANGLPVQEKITLKIPSLMHSTPLGSNLNISKDPYGILVSDYNNRRIVRLSDTLSEIDFFGSFGTGEAEFLTPSLVKSLENRIFVYDRTRSDIQIFDPLYNSVTKLTYDPVQGDDNYFAPNFLEGLVDMAIITKEENSRVYYYGLLMSATTAKLAMIRLPQWEEMRVQVKNNRIVYLKDREIYTAKPTGSDLRRIVSSDAIPRIEGTLDYPALSPDGRKIVFTSKMSLYDGNGDASASDGSTSIYNKLYIINEDGTGLRRIPLDTIGNYEIERPEFSSNGDRVIFSGREPGKKWQLYVYNCETGGVAKLFTSSENARFPYYSPDDRFVAFTTDYDGDEEIEIFDTQNPTVRVSLTNNNCRDSYPVWSAVYPYEISNPDLKIDSKIAFVSERNYHKGLYYTYISRPSESDLRVVKKTGEQIGDDPDQAAIEITNSREEGDYPCLTGDGKKAVFEYFNGESSVLRGFKFDDQSSPFYSIDLPEGSRKPSGMKNTIANYGIKVVNGNDAELSWTPYTDTDIFYTVRFKKNVVSENFVQKKVFTQNGTVLKGLEMGVEYIFKVSIFENGEEAASTQWKKLKVPTVAAIPSVEIDKDNPYVVKLHAWNPKPEVPWYFTWFIDNQPFSAETSQDYVYEFGTSGRKTIALKATDAGKTNTSVSEPMSVDIASDIKPVIQYVLADDSSYIELDARNSKGNRIDWAASTWLISGPGRQPLPPLSGSKIIVPLDGFEHKINVLLDIRRVPVNGQSATDTIEGLATIDLDYKAVKPVITYEADKTNNRLFTFSGTSSLGNIDWLRARWIVYSDGAEIHREDGVSTLAYLFPETNSAVNYSVSLTVPRRNDGKTETTAIIVAVQATPIDPVIDYEILTLKEGNNVVGAKVLFSCGNSKGSNIDFSQARWSVPVAGSYEEQPTQIGPTAIYNLRNAPADTLVEVSLTLSRHGGTDVKTVTKVITLKSGEVPQPELIVNVENEDTSSGTAYVFDVLKSKGANIDWEKTDWLFDGQYARKGPVARLDALESGEKTVISYTCVLYFQGSDPIKATKQLIKKASTIRPLVSKNKKGSASDRVYELSVLDTQGVNIDWDKTMWYIYDGNESVVQKQGATILHTFIPKSEAYGYPIMVEMFVKGSGKPFVKVESIDIEGDALIPVITFDDENKGWDTGGDKDPNTIHFSAESSLGSNIDWNQAKWTFGDSSEAQYGSSAIHKYPLDAKAGTYTVSLSLTRRSSNGATESKTSYKPITIGADEIKPKIRARLYGDGYLVLSAEESEGRGLLLDRCSWLFEGKGDNESVNVNEKIGVVQSDSYNWGISDSLRLGSEMCGYSISRNAGSNFNTTSYDGFKDMTSSFTSANEHTGAVCRKYVKEYNMSAGNWGAKPNSITVTLFVYRPNRDGSMDGRSVTVNVDLNKANSFTDSAAKGVLYE